MTKGFRVRYDRQDRRSGIMGSVQISDGYGRPQIFKTRENAQAKVDATNAHQEKNHINKIHRITKYEIIPV